MAATRRRPSETVAQDVFLNVPFDRGYEPLFVTLVASVVCLGLKPRCSLEITDVGQGRFNKIENRLASCRTSIHDISRVGTPVRFNMPFELGLAFGLSRYATTHNVIVLERKRHRLDRTLSDLRHIDPLIHGGRCGTLVSCVLDAFIGPDSKATPTTVRRVAGLLRKFAVTLKDAHRRHDVYSRAIYLDLVSAAVDLAVDENLIDE